jgi:hypothetical protein
MTIWFLTYMEALLDKYFLKQNVLDFGRGGGGIDPR